MADNNFDLHGFLNDPQVQADKPSAIKYLQDKGIIDQQGNPVAGMYRATSQKVMNQENPISTFGSNITGNTTPDQGALFSTNNQQSTDNSFLGTAGIAAKAAANVVPDFVRTTAGFPIQAAGQLVDVAKNIGGLVKNSTIENNLTPAAQAAAKAKGLNQGETQNALVGTIKNYLSAAIDPHVYVQALKQIIPSAAQKVVQGDYSGAAQDIANHPFQQIAPFLLTLEQGSKAIGKGEAFDAAISKTAEPVIKATKVVATVPVAAVKGATKLGNVLARYGTSQATGLSPETISRIISNPKDFSPEAMRSFTREGIAQEAFGNIQQRLDDLSSTGKEYQGIRETKIPVRIDQNKIQGVFGKHGITFDENNNLKFTKDSTPTSPGDRHALQDWYDTFIKQEVPNVYGDVPLDSNSLLNARKGLDNVAKWDSTKTKASSTIAKDLYSELNKTGRPQVKGLAELDKKFSAETQQLSKIKKDYFNKDGTIKDNAIGKIANLSAKGRDPILVRLEQVSPGIGEKIRTLKAVEDIHNASGQKTGTYIRAAVTGGGILTGNVPAIIASILATPQIATQILRGYGKTLGVGSDVMARITKAYESSRPLRTRIMTTTPNDKKNSFSNKSNIK